jgi:thiol-disulfide isomerase/thioredoxin
MKVILPVLLTFLFQSSVNVEVTTLSFDARDFRESFNAAADQPRVVGVFSPTCGHCLQACSELQEILKERPEARLKVFLLWAPFMKRDTLPLAQRATGYLPDRRVYHFWDLWKYAAKVYQEQLKIPKGNAWDMFVFYKPHLLWQDSLPEPTFWLQNRGLDVGTPYSQENLKAGIEEWIE